MENSILDSFKDIVIDKTIHSELKEKKYILRNENLIQNDISLICNPPRSLFFLQEDGTLLDLIVVGYYSYISINTKTGKPTLKKGKSKTIKFIENEIEDIYKTEENLISKILYDLAQIEKKSKGKEKIIVNPNKLLNISYRNKTFNSYQVNFIKKDGSVERDKIKAGNDEQVNFLANYVLKTKKDYIKVDFIYMYDFGKTFWEQMFVVPQKRKPLKTKDLEEFTRKLYKFFKAYKNAGIREGIGALVSSTDGNIRATAIGIASIMKEGGIDNAYDAFLQLNNEDIKLGNKVNFDTVYLSILRLMSSKSGGDGIPFDIAFGNLAELINRRVFLESSLKKALKGPIFVLIILILIGGFTVNMFAPVLFQIYSGIGEPNPPITVLMSNIINFSFISIFPENLLGMFPSFIQTIIKIITSNGFFVIIFLYMLILLYKFFGKNTFYGKKTLNNISLSVPIVGNFFKRSQFEIFLTVAGQLYGSKGGGEHGKSLPILKTTLSNFHLQGIINTAGKNFTEYNTNPGYTFDKYPYYINEKITNIFKSATPDGGELLTLKESFKIDNDEFITNLKAIIQNGLLFVAGGILLLIIFATIIPMLNLATKI